MPEETNLNSQTTTPPKKVIAEEMQWEDYEYEFLEKTSDWFWIYGTIAVLAIIISVMLSNYLLALIIALGAFILGSYAKREPGVITYGLAKDGIKFDNHFFRYDSIRSFWINPANHLLTIESGRLIKPHINIPLHNTDEERVHRLLLSIIEEKEYVGSITDNLANFFGF